MPPRRGFLLGRKARPGPTGAAALPLTRPGGRQVRGVYGRQRDGHCILTSPEVTKNGWRSKTESGPSWPNGYVVAGGGGSDRAGSSLARFRRRAITAGRVRRSRVPAGPGTLDLADLGVQLNCRVVRPRVRLDEGDPGGWESRAAPTGAVHLGIRLAPGGTPSPAARKSLPRKRRPARRGRPSARSRATGVAGPDGFGHHRACGNGERDHGSRDYDNRYAPPHVLRFLRVRMRPVCVWRLGLRRPL